MARAANTTMATGGSAAARNQGFRSASGATDATDMAPSTPAMNAIPGNASSI
jgi:hypothetical protein